MERNVSPEEAEFFFERAIGHYAARIMTACMEAAALNSTSDKELQEHILIAERLTQSKADYAALGHDDGDMEYAQQETEDRIKILLKALQDLHLAIVQRNISSSTPVLEQVQSLLSQIDAELEVENNSPSTRKAKMIAKRQKNKHI